jgi:hypothetical protein
MQRLVLALLLSVALSAGVAPVHGHAALPRYQPAHVARASDADKKNPPYGLVLSGEMLVGGVALMAGSAYALRRSRR